MHFPAASPRRGVRAALAAAAMLVAGCTDHGGLVQPIGAPYLTLEYRADRRSTPSGEAIDFTARVFNRGRTPVTYLAGCGPSSFRIEIVDPERRNLFDLCRCPGAVCVACAPSRLPLKPGRWLTIRTTFTGTLVDCDGPFQGPTGRYAATATFSGTTLYGTTTTLSRSTLFDWTASSP